MSIKKKRDEDLPVTGWVFYTNTRSGFCAGKTMEEAAEKFQDTFGYFPDPNLLEPILEKK